MNKDAKEVGDVGVVAKGGHDLDFFFEEEEVSFGETVWRGGGARWGEGIGARRGGGRGDGD